MTTDEQNEERRLVTEWLGRVPSWIPTAFQRLDSTIRNKEDQE